MKKRSYKTSAFYRHRIYAGRRGLHHEKTQSAKAPDVDVDPGRWPKYNVKWADVDVGTTTKTITVPKLEWNREQTQVQVPYIDINGPGQASRRRADRDCRIGGARSAREST